VPQKNPIEIQFEYFSFIQGALDFYRQQNLVELAHKRALEAQKVVSGHLHGERTAAGALFTGEHQF